VTRNNLRTYGREKGTAEKRLKLNMKITKIEIKHEDYEDQAWQRKKAT